MWVDIPAWDAWDSIKAQRDTGELWIGVKVGSSASSRVTSLKNYLHRKIFCKKKTDNNSIFLRRKVALEETLVVRAEGNGVGEEAGGGEKQGRLRELGFSERLG